jgi:hypothetical protein
MIKKLRFQMTGNNADDGAVKRELESLFEIVGEYRLRAKRGRDKAILGKLFTFWEMVDDRSMDYLAMTTDRRRLPPLHAVHYRGWASTFSPTL